MTHQVLFEFHLFVSFFAVVVFTGTYDLGREVSTGLIKYNYVNILVVVVVVVVVVEVVVVVVVVFIYSFKYECACVLNVWTYCKKLYVENGWAVLFGLIPSSQIIRNILRLNSATQIIKYHCTHCPFHGIIHIEDPLMSVHGVVARGY